MIPRISVCIPAYNRSEVLPELLDSIVNQSYKKFEIIICEDKSPQREKIAAIIADYSQKYPGLIHYFENEINLGYDANLRNLFDKAHGDYCFFMGNDDLMCPEALEKVGAAVDKHPNVGVVLRSYSAFNGTPDNVVQMFRYFPKELFFPAGVETIGTIYRRSVVIPGMVINRKAALKWSSDKFDGTLLYQLYLVGNILADYNAVFLPDILVLYRNGGVPDFGNSEKEKGKFVPTEQTPESSVFFMKGMLDIPASIQKERGLPIYNKILTDIGNYCYPILAIQANKGFGLFCKYAWQLGKLGFFRVPMFYVYTLSILLLGTKNVDRMVLFLKRRLGYTPTIGKIYRGNI